MSQPRKRKTKELHAAAADQIPLAHPDRNTRPAKTLLDIAAEEHPFLTRNKTITTKTLSLDADGCITNHNSPSTVNENGDNDEEAAVDALGEAIFYALSLAMVHFTLDVLVHNQYAEAFAWRDMAWRSVTASGILLLLVYIMHPRASSWPGQAVFLAGGVAAGCYLVSASSRYSYFAVMKQAPPVGTLWIWSVVEQRAEVALVGVVCVGVFFWWGGYSIYS